jgi:hypothetical protein
MRLKQTAGGMRKTKLNSYLTAKAGRQKKRPAFVFVAWAWQLESRALMDDARVLQQDRQQK